MNQVLAFRRQYEQIFVLRRLYDDGFTEALHVPANPGVADSPQVESNFSYRALKMMPPGPSEFSRSGQQTFSHGDKNRMNRGVVKVFNQLPHYRKE